MRLGALLVAAAADEARALPGRATMLEKVGFDSLWSAQAIGRGFMVVDPFITLSVAATHTSTVELGTAILQLPLYSPADIALKAFSLMQISGNRLLLGIGAGSTQVDHDVHHTVFEDRFQNFNKGLIELRTWFEHGGDGENELSPWASVVGGPPILHGTWGAGVERAAKEFSGWIGSGMHRTPEQLEEAIVLYRAAGGLRAIVSTIRLGPDKDIGTVKSLLQRYKDAGFDDAVVMFVPGGVTPDQVRSMID